MVLLLLLLLMLMLFLVLFLLSEKGWFLVESGLVGTVLVSDVPPHLVLAVYFFRSSEELCQEADVVMTLCVAFGRALAKTRALSLTKTRL